MYSSLSNHYTNSKNIISQNDSTKELNWLILQGLSNNFVIYVLQGDQRELRKSMTLLLRLWGSVGTKTYGKISLRSGHFDIWLLEYKKKTFSVIIEVCDKLSDFHI